MPGHFKNGGVIQPSLDVCRDSKIYFIDNTIGVETMYDLIDIVKYQYMPIMRKLQCNTMAGCGIRAKKGKSKTKTSKAALSDIFKIR